MYELLLSVFIVTCALIIVGVIFMLGLKVHKKTEELYKLSKLLCNSWDEIIKLKEQLEEKERIIRNERTYKNTAKRQKDRYMRLYKDLYEHCADIED